MERARRTRPRPLRRGQGVFERGFKLAAVDPDLGGETGDGVQGVAQTIVGVGVIGRDEELGERIEIGLTGELFDLLRNHAVPRRGEEIREPFHCRAPTRAARVKRRRNPRSPRNGLRENEKKRRLTSSNLLQVRHIADFYAFLRTFETPETKKCRPSCVFSPFEALLCLGYGESAVIQSARKLKAQRGTGCLLRFHRIFNLRPYCRQPSGAGKEDTNGTGSLRFSL